MCGINGLITGDNNLKRKIIAMNRMLRHRGPDDEGFVLINSADMSSKECSGDDSPPSIKAKYPGIHHTPLENFDVLLGHRRLSIIDLSECGHGPMCDISGKLWLSFNGEIYNYIELRGELASLGYKFKSGTDTEVIINSYLHWGRECLNRFNGMWSFALWDGRTGELFLARDRFGVKPLHYSDSTGYFAFSSEIKPLAFLFDSIISVNKNKIPFFVLYGNRLNTRDTYISGISSLQASHYLIYKEGKISVSRYYDIREVNITAGEEKLKNRIVSTLSDSIRLRFRSDVPVGTCLSGGFDSSSIAALSSGLGQNKLQTFSAVWKEKQCDESKYIDIVNERFGCVPNKITPRADEFEKVFTELSLHQEIPTEGPGLYPQWYVMAKAKGNVTVLLDGQGGDEVFGGYFLLGAYLRSIISDRKLYKTVSEFKYFAEFLRKSGVHSFAGWLFPRQYSRLLKTRLSKKFEILNDGVSAAAGNLDFDIEPERKFKSYINNLSYHFITNITIPTLLHYEDRSSMAHSIESRVPFLDYRLVELGLNLKPEYLANRGLSRPLYRRALEPYLPKEITNRKDKLGFPTPFAEWSRTALKDYISDTLFKPNALVYEYVNRAKVVRNIEDHFTGLKDYSWEIWRFLSLENFLRLYSNFEFAGAGTNKIYAGLN